MKITLMRMRLLFLGLQPQEQQPGHVSRDRLPRSIDRTPPISPEPDNHPIECSIRLGVNDLRLGMREMPLHDLGHPAL